MQGLTSAERAYASRMPVDDRSDAEIEASAAARIEAERLAAEKATVAGYVYDKNAWTSVTAARMNAQLMAA